jgi:hypothetical protein
MPDPSRAAPMKSTVPQRRTEAARFFESQAGVPGQFTNDECPHEVGIAIACWRRLLHPPLICRTGGHTGESLDAPAEHTESGRTDLDAREHRDGTDLDWRPTIARLHSY